MLLLGSVIHVSQNPSASTGGYKSVMKSSIGSPSFCLRLLSHALSKIISLEFVKHSFPFRSGGKRTCWKVAILIYSSRLCRVPRRKADDLWSSMFEWHDVQTCHWLSSQFSFLFIHLLVSQIDILPSGIGYMSFIGCNQWTGMSFCMHVWYQLSNVARKRYIFILHELIPNPVLNISPLHSTSHKYMTYYDCINSIHLL